MKAVMQLCRIATTYFSRRTRSRSSVCKADRRHNANSSEAERMRLLSDGMLTNIPESTSLNICMILFSEISFEKFRCGTGGSCFLIDDYEAFPRRKFT